MTTYNGWTNYATWRVNLEIFDGTTAEDHVGTGGRNRLASLMDTLRDTAEDLVSETDNSLARDYALAFVSDVNWREIAEHMLEDEEEEEEEEEEDEEGATLADPPATIEIECSPYMRAVIKAALGDN